MTRAPSLAVVGGANADFVVRSAQLPRPGETVIGGDLAKYPGGKGANQACAGAHLGMATSFVGCVGVDELGSWLTANFEAHNVDLTFLQRSQRATGAALIAVDIQGENLIVVAPGANLDLSLANIPLEGFDIVLGQLESDLEIVEEVAHRAETFVLNAAPSRKVPDEILEQCALVIVNQHESESLNHDAVRRSVVTYGAAGAAYLERGVEIARVDAPTVTPVDTVGAGDVFCAAFVAQFVIGKAPLDSLHFAVTAGALATLGAGAQGALPTESEVAAWIGRES